MFNKYQNHTIEAKDITSVFISLQGKNNSSYTQRIFEAYPEFLHRMYRIATRELGDDARFAALAHEMNKRAKQMYPDCPIRGQLHLSKHHLVYFFASNAGKKFQPASQPIITPANRLNRLTFTQDTKGYMLDNNVYYCFIDEKWFYLQSKCTKFKYLPPGSFKTEEDALVKHPKEQSCHFALKVMFMGIVAPPNIEKNFDGKIYMKRVCNQVKQKATSYNQIFHETYEINNMLKDGVWREFYDKGMTFKEFVEQIEATFDLPADILPNIVLTYHTYSSTGKSRPLMKIRDGSVLEKRTIRDSPNKPLRPLTLKDLKLRVIQESGVYYDKDTTCDSEFMMSVVNEIGSAIRDKFHFIPKITPVYLYIDNAGGHGTDLIKDQYTKILKDTYNVCIKWQCPNSPETNMLDLGAWRSIQSIVEHEHRGKAPTANQLSNTVMEAFDRLDSTTLTKINDRWEKVMELIIAGDGSNEFVEKNHGLTSTLHLLPKLEFKTPI